MENLFNCFETTKSFEILGYFSSEILCLIGIILNIIFFLFFRKKLNIKRVSDFITFGVFSLNSIIAGFLYFRNIYQFDNFNLTFLNDVIVIDNNSLFYKFAIYVFFAIFILSTYLVARKARFKTPLINSLLLMLAPCATLITQLQNNILTFLLFELSLLFIYKYASVAKIKKFSVYCPDYVVMSSTATILTFAFYSLSFFIKAPLQLAIVNVCITMALFLKSGLFPIYNYTLNRSYKNNIPYSILLFSFAPFLGLNVLAKFVKNFDITNEAYIVSIFVFISVLIITCAINAFRTKNLVKYVANISCAYFGFFAILNFITQDIDFVNRCSLNFIFVILSIFSLLCALKKNLKSEKLNFAILRGLFIRNRIFCAVFSLCILIISNVIPTSFLFQNIQALNIVYVYDLLGSCLAFILLVSNILILFNGLSAIKLCYTKSILIPIKLTKRTTLNYVVPCVIFFILILKIFI